MSKTSLDLVGINAKNMNQIKNNLHIDKDT